MNAAITRGIGRLTNLDQDSTNTRHGTATALPSTGINNTVVGYLAGGSLTSGTDNVCIGWNAGASLRYDGFSVLIGSEAGRWAQDSTNVPTTNTLEAIAIGYQALRGTSVAVPSTATTAIAIGYQAMKNGATGGGNIAIGTLAMQGSLGAPSGANNIGLGNGVLSALTSGANNTAIGSGGNGSMGSLTDGAENVGVGRESLRDNSGGSQNTAVGNYSLQSVSGSDNTGFGYGALYTANNNSANATTSGARNVAVGRDTGQSSSTQRSDFVAVGYRAVVNGNNAIAIGSGVSAGAAGAVAIGKDSGGTSAATTTADGFRLGTTLHTVEIPGLIQWITSGNEQTTVGAPGAASALPATPTKYLKIKDSAGTTLVIPAYAAS